MLRHIGKVEQAVASIREALRIDPAYAEAYSNLCDVFEKRNMFDELEVCVDEALQAFPEGHPEISFRSAQLLSSQKNLEEARATLEKILPDELPANLQLSYFVLLGKTYEGLGLFDQAFRQYEAQNAAVRNSSLVQKYDADLFLESVRELSQGWKSKTSPIWSETIEAVDTNLAFLIGFPRSGTTLLDTILRGHREIVVVEEQPMVNAMVDKLGHPATLDVVTQMQEAEIVSLRKVYFEELAKHYDASDHVKLIVDKLPLNIRDIGLIHRCFPSAKFILALRHPSDCVLSCFMQNFTLNNAMANFLTLEQSATLYAEIMQLWQFYRKTLSLEIGELKYEDLIEDIKGTCLPLIEFLDLEWDDKLLDYQQTAQARSAINTPSYAQVFQPLYKELHGRWEKYIEHMQLVQPLLQPWIKEFGYSS
ncbi:MAG: hypothetical protein HON14_17585 [Rhodospirillaceae bacterium]|nr:hypothetical protein [Rhodospirillaceae bacterium]